MKRIAQVSLSCLLAALLAACQPVSTPLARWQHSPNGSLAAALSHQGNLAATSALDTQILVWEDSRVNFSLRHQQEASSENLVYLLAFSADGHRLASAEQHKFALWDTRLGQSLGLWSLEEAGKGEAKESSITDIALSDSGQYLLLGQSSGVATHLDTQSGRRLEFLGHSEKINAVALSPNGRYALTGGNDYVAYLWDTQSGQPLHRFIHGSRISQVALDQQGRYGFTADSLQQARIWDLRTGQPVSQLRVAKRQGIFSSARFSADGHYLLTGSPDRHVRLWRISDGKQISEWYVPPRTRLRPSGAVVHAVAFAGDSVITESSTGYGARWALPEGLNQIH